MKSKFPGEEFKHYTDTGSVLEKLWAWRAGLGWQGRHSLLINRRLGSWCFISVIITSLEIEADTQSNDFCGSCTSCITACPTNAIVADKVVDSGKCISYWTIESKGIQEFPAYISGNLNGWLFGCDICQEVCPWNSKTKSTQIAEFLPRNNQTTLTRDYINSLDNETFKLRFRNSPIKRRKLGGLQLNMKEIK
jgi:epoxyqueuosine reductase